MLPLFLKRRGNMKLGDKFNTELEIYQIIHKKSGNFYRLCLPNDYNVNNTIEIEESDLVRMLKQKESGEK